MVDPASLTGATLVSLAASKFVEATAKQLGDVVTPAVLKQAGSQIDAMWQKIKQHFAGNKKAEAAISQVETRCSPAARNKLVVYLDDELLEPENYELAQDLQQIAQQIINIGQQQNELTRNRINVSGVSDEAKVNVVGEVNGARTVNIGSGGT